MPVLIDIFDFKCFNQLRNGENFDKNLSEFTPNLVGNIGERVQVEFKANLTQYAAAENNEEWTFVELVDNVEIEVTRSSGSFNDDAIQVGDRFQYYQFREVISIPITLGWAQRKVTTPYLTGGVDFISSDGKVMRFTVISYDTPPIADFLAGTFTDVGMAFDQLAVENLNTAMFHKFGLIGNDETFNYNSKTTESLQVWYRGSLAPSSEPPSFVDAESLGSIKDWVSGLVQVGLSTDDPDFKAAQYVFKHDFVLNPFYILSFREFIDAGTIPDLLAGDSSIKYAFELEFRKTLTNTGSSKIQSFDILDGFVGWYKENFNGLNIDYEVASIAYEDVGTADPLDGININADTKATIVVSNLSGAITNYSCSVHLIKLPTSEDDYIGTETDLLENFIYKSEVVSSPDTTSPNVTTSLVSGNLVIEYDISYTTAEKLALSTDDEYLLLVQVEDPTVSAGNSDRIMLIADLKNYTDIDFIAGFVNVASYNILQHLQQIGDTGGLLQILSNEDGILLDAVIGTDLSKEVVINSIAVDLIAYSPSLNRSFTLDQYNFNLGEPVVVGGVSEISVDSTRGYPLPASDEFNLAKANNLAQAGGFQEYAIQIGQKIKWQDWIFNPDVDNVFFDGTLPNNNLNERASNYSGEETYQIKLALTLNVTGLDDLGRLVTGDFINYGPDLTINDYDESTDGVTGVIQTFDLETGNSLEGNILYNGKDTLFRAVFQDAAAMQYGIHRIEPSQNQGDGILELSSVKPSVANNILKPLDGETQLTFDLIGSVLTTECLIDGSLIQEGIAYKLSARVAQQPLILENGFEFTINTALGSGTNNFQLPLDAAGTYDLIIDKGNGDPLVFITAWNDPATLLTYAAGGVYDVKIYGTLIGWSFNNSGDNEKMVDISNWGILRRTTPLNGEFYGCSNMTISAIDIWDITGNENLLNLFRDCSSITTIPNIGDWDVSNINNFNSVFNGCTNFNSSVDNWTISNVLPNIQMSNMFQGCTLFNQPLNSWNTSGVSTMSDMFRAASTFDQDLDNWDVSNVLNMGFMFFGATAFNGNIDNWITSSVNNMLFLFDSCPNFNRDISGWDVSSVTVMFRMFRGATIFNQDISGWNVGLVSNMVGMLQNCPAFDQDLGAWDVTGLTDASNFLAGSTLSTANYDALLVGWEGKAVQNGVVLSGGNSTYTAAGAGGTARAALIADHLWVITDGGGV